MAEVKIEKGSRICEVMSKQIESVPQESMQRGLLLPEK